MKEASWISTGTFLGQKLLVCDSSRYVVEVDFQTKELSKHKVAKGDGLGMYCHKDILVMICESQNIFVLKEWIEVFSLPVQQKKRYGTGFGCYSRSSKRIKDAVYFICEATGRVKSFNLEEAWKFAHQLRTEPPEIKHHSKEDIEEFDVTSNTKHVYTLSKKGEVARDLQVLVELVQDHIGSFYSLALGPSFIVVSYTINSNKETIFELITLNGKRQSSPILAIKDGGCTRHLLS